MISKRAAVATLAQHTDLCDQAIANKLEVSPKFVRKWKNKTSFETPKRSGRPRNALTPTNMKKIRKCAGKSDQSVRRLATRYKISKSSVSRGFLQQGLPSLRRPKQSKLKPQHIQWRYECAAKFKSLAPKDWEKFLITDEKLWTTNGMINPQNDRVRAKSSDEVPALDMEKFPGKRMTWLGMSARGLTKLYWVKGTVNGASYREKILKNQIVKDVLRRKKKSSNITKTKLFVRNPEMIFEQDFARPHSTNANQRYMEENFPNHTPTLHRYRDTHPYFFPPKMDDFWPIERLWAILAQKVFRHPRPEHIDAVMRRIREAVRETKPETLTKLVHAMPAKMNEIYRLKGKKIGSSFDPSKSPFACKCGVCLG